MWKLQDFTATLILREIDFGQIAALNFAFFGIFYIVKCEIPQKSKFLTFSEINENKIDLT